MLRQALLALLVHRMARLDLLQAVPHQELVVARGEDGGGDVDQDGDPRVAVVGGEDAAAEKRGGRHAGAEVTGQVGGDGVAGEAPHHGGVGEADGEGDGGRGDEGVGRVQARPDHDADVAVHEELLEEEEALVGLVGVGDHAGDAGDAAVVDCCSGVFQFQVSGGLWAVYVRIWASEGKERRGRTLGGLRRRKYRRGGDMDIPRSQASSIR